MGTVSYIPLGLPFLKTVVSGLMQRVEYDSALLMDIEILLPTRRAVRAMTDLFLDVTHGKPLLLPRMRAVADMDDDALEMMVASVTGASTHLAPTLSSFESQLILAELIRARDPNIDFTRSLALSQALLDFLKSIRDEGLNLDRIDQLVAAEFAAHWQITVDFLNILRTAWPEYLRAAQRMDGHDRRSALFDQLMMFWRDHPPQHSIIMVGITGSLPHVAALMKVVAALPRGEVILPGFDPYLPESHRDNLDPQHPQYELDHVIHHLEIDRSHIDIWNGVLPGNPDLNYIRGLWIQQMMCPGACTSDWVQLKQKLSPDDIVSISNDLKNIKIISNETIADEARVIALQVRCVLESPESFVTIVTPDRALSAAVISACARFGIEVNDSAGEILKTCQPAQFLIAVLKVAVHGFSPLALLDLLRHPIFFMPGFDLSHVHILDHHFLRGIRPPVDPALFLEALRSKELPQLIQEIMSQLIDILDPLRQICCNGGSVIDIARVHLKISEQLSRRSSSGVSMIWTDEDGEELSRLFSDILSLEVPMRLMTGYDYQSFIDHIFSKNRINRRGVGHPRVALLGVYESRLLGTDHVILAGFNEGLWPVDPGVDPWLSRSMRRDFGLPPLEQVVGRLAHDVVQLMHTKDVTITYRSMSDGVSVLPSRWLHRFFSVMHVLFGEQNDLCRSNNLNRIVQLLDHQNLKLNVSLDMKRPEPRPPISVRPVQFSATQLETWVSDPYSLYAQKILRLKPLDPIDQEADDRIKGILLHEALERIIRSDHYYESKKIIFELLDKYHVDLSVRSMIAPRLIAILNRVEEYDRDWRNQGYVPFGVEQTFGYHLDVHGTVYHITARLDRLDQNEQGDYVVIDYKTGAGLPTYKNIESGVACQLIIQALCVRQGINIETKLSFHQKVLGAALWHLKSRDVQAMMILRDNTDRDLNDLCDQADEGIYRLIRTFQDSNTPYYPIPDPSILPARSMYDHLSRRKIWWGAVT